MPGCLSDLPKYRKEREDSSRHLSRDDTLFSRHVFLPTEGYRECFPTIEIGSPLRTAALVEHPSLVLDKMVRRSCKTAPKIEGAEQNSDLFIAGLRGTLCDAQTKPGAGKSFGRGRRWSSQSPSLVPALSPKSTTGGRDPCSNANSRGLIGTPVEIPGGRRSQERYCMAEHGDATGAWRRCALPADQPWWLPSSR